MAAHKFWKITNIVDRSQGTVLSGASIGLLRFNTAEGTSSSTASRAFGLNYSESTPPSVAFTGNNTTGFYGNPNGAGRSEVIELGYSYAAPVTVTSINTQMYAYVGDAELAEWQSCIVESSDDGIVWAVEGWCDIKTPVRNFSSRRSNVLPIAAPTETAHQFWRVTDVMTYASFPEVSTKPLKTRKLFFRTSDGATSYHFPQGLYSSKGTVNVNDGTTPLNAFKGTAGEEGLLIGDAIVPSAAEKPWYLGYDFKRPVTVSALGYIPTTTEAFGSEWHSVKLQGSDDGLVWVDQGFVTFPSFIPLTREEFLSQAPIYSPVTAGRVPSSKPYPYSSSVVVPPSPRAVFSPNRLKAPITVDIDSTQFSPAIQGVPAFEAQVSKTLWVDRFGYIAGTIYERVGDTATKIPVARRVLLYHQLSGRLVAETFSNADGTYLFNLLNEDAEFMIVSVDHNRRWGLEGTAFKKARRSVVDGLSVQYPRD